MTRFKAGAVLEIDYEDTGPTLGIALRGGSTDNPGKKTHPVLLVDEKGPEDTNGAPFRVAHRSVWQILKNS